jgi:hypothetical protein
MHNQLRRNSALFALLLSVVVLTSAFVIPQCASAQVILGTPGGDPNHVVPPANLKAYTSGNLILLRWEFNTFSRQDSNAPQITTIYRSEDGQNFKRLITIPAVIGLFSDSTITPGKNYYYRVSFSRVVQSSVPGAPGYEVESSFANLAQPVMIPVATPPAPQVVLTAQPTSYGAVALSWNPYPGAIDYTVYRKQVGTFVPLAEKVISTGLIDVTVSKGVQFSYYIVPRTLNGLAPSSDVVMVTPVPTNTSNNLTTAQLTAQLSTEPVDIRGSKVSLTMTPPINQDTTAQAQKPDYYKVFRSTNDRFYQLILKKDTSELAGAFTFDDVGLQGNTTYWYRIVAGKKEGVETPLLTTTPVQVKVPSVLQPIPFPTTGEARYFDHTTGVMGDYGRLSFDLPSDGNLVAKSGETLKFNYYYHAGQDGNQSANNYSSHVRVSLSLLGDKNNTVATQSPQVLKTGNLLVYPLTNICYSGKCKETLGNPLTTETVHFPEVIPLTFEQYLNPATFKPGNYQLAITVNIQPIISEGLAVNQNKFELHGGVNFTEYIPLVITN